MANDESYLKVEELVEGKAYEVDGRNFSVAIWCNGKFHGMRSKWGSCYMDTEDHWDNNDEGTGTVKPLRMLD